MGQEASTPRPGTRLRVIGAGPPGSGVANLCAALSILYEEPVYHGRGQVCLGSEEQGKAWIAALNRLSRSDSTLVFKEEDRQLLLRQQTSEGDDFITRQIHERLAGFVAVADAPVWCFMPELLRLYPDAKVVVTTGGRRGQADSLPMRKTVLDIWCLSVILFWLSSVRLYPAFNAAVKGQLQRRLFQQTPRRLHCDDETWERYMEYVEDVVPKKRLVYYGPREGWGPLCEALGVDIPDRPFPTIDEAAEEFEFAWRQVRRGLNLWAVVLGGIILIVGALWMGLTGW